MDNQIEWEEYFLNSVCVKFRRVTPELEVLYPYSTHEGRYERASEMSPFVWTCGFWGGIQWLLYKLTGEKMFYEKAKMASARMDGGLVLFEPLSHDVGFQYLLTTVADYVFTKSDRARISSLHAANLLAGRFNPVGKFIRAWDEPGQLVLSQYITGSAIIDCMMNLPLLFWATIETGDPRYKHIAMLHADTVMREFIREDDSSEHIVVFDAETGEVIDKPRGQGYSVGSAWTRGQAWAIYGFAMAYGYTGKAEYLRTAVRCSKYFLSKLSDDGIPPCDFLQPEKPEYKDASAGVAAASGLIELKKWLNKSDREMFEEGIRKLLRGAYECCDFSGNDQAILKNCMSLYHGTGKQQSFIYGEFYLLEALMKRHGERLIFKK